MAKSKQTDAVYSLKGKVKARTAKAVLIEYWRDGGQVKEIWVPRAIAEIEMNDGRNSVTAIIPEWFVSKNGLEEHVE